MNVKGFLMEDDQGREFVVVCEQPQGQPQTAFALRGWQRRRLVPMAWTGPELRRITGDVRTTLQDLVQRLPKVAEHV